MGSPINWGPVPQGSPVLVSEYYLQFSGTTFSDIDSMQLRNAISGSLASNDSAETLAYLLWVARVLNILGLM